MCENLVSWKPKLPQLPNPSNSRIFLKENMTSFERHLLPSQGNQIVRQPMNKDEETMVLCMNIFDQITYGGNNLRKQ